MKIRGSHIAGVVLAAIAGFVIIAIYLATRPPQWQDDDEFLEQIRGTRDRPGVGTGALLPPEGTDPERTPRIEIETEVHLGTVPNEEPSLHAVTVRNPGRRPLEIRDIQTTCPCTMGRFAQDPPLIPAGGEAELEILFSPALAPGFNSVQTLTIRSNDPVRPHVQVRVEADIVPEFELEPETADFGTVVKGSRPEITLRLRQLREEPFDVFGVEPLSDEGLLEIEGDVSPVPQEEWRDADRAEWDVHVRLLPYVPTGPYHRVARIVSDIERMPGYPLHVHAEVVVPYTVEPAFPRRMVVRRNIEDETETRATTTITSPGPVEVAELQPLDSHFDVQLLETEEPETLVLEVALREDTPPGRHQQEFTYIVITQGEAFPERMAVIGYVDAPGQPAPLDPFDDEEFEDQEAPGQDHDHSHDHDHDHGAPGHVH